MLALLPDHVGDRLRADPEVDSLVEVVLDLGRYPEARFAAHEVVLDDIEVTTDDLASVTARIGAFGDDNRAGIPRTLHRISAIRNRHGAVVGLTCRVGRSIIGTVELVRALVEGGKSILILGRPGVGKTTILRLLLERLPQLVPSVSATTRPPRTGERDGADYHFLSPEDFDRRRAAGEFLECCRVYGRQHWYGTLVAEVAPRLAAGKWVVLEIDVEGTISILERFPEAITIFVEPSHPDQLLQRLQGRGTESPEAMARRLEVARKELHEAHRYRHRVVNEDVDAALAEIERILAATGLPFADRPASRPLTSA